jgi:hypothetical protein
MGSVMGGVHNTHEMTDAYEICHKTSIKLYSGD